MIIIYCPACGESHEESDYPVGLFPDPEWATWYCYNCDTGFNISIAFKEIKWSNEEETGGFK